MLSLFRRRRAKPPAVPPPRSDDALADVLRQVRRIELRTRGLVTSRFSGEYHSVFKGQGIEFVEVREYLPGDDVRTIDWNVSARTGETYVKKYIEERELTVLLAVDLSGSQRFGTRGRFRSELVAEVAATLAMSAVRNNDRVGLLVFTDRIEAFVPPRKGRRHVLRLIRDLLAFEPAGSGTDLAAAVAYATRLLRSRSIIFLLSDFQVSGDAAPFEKAMATASFRHDVIPISLTDPADVDLPDAGLLRVVDPETGERVTVDSSNPSVRRAFAESVDEERARTRSLFRRLGMDEVELRTDTPWSAPLLAFFRRRESRLRR
ncbi:MAG TPA: DUF58 domain-containing protein [Longimicrobiaceae bacterium]|nr:DUF58 domain-containing protein [Longimicrobiaceae bacterium]